MRLIHSKKYFFFTRSKFVLEKRVKIIKQMIKIAPVRNEEHVNCLFNIILE